MIARIGSRTLALAALLAAAVGIGLAAGGWADGLVPADG